MITIYFIYISYFNTILDQPSTSNVMKYAQSGEWSTITTLPIRPLVRYSALTWKDVGNRLTMLGGIVQGTSSIN